MASAAAAAGLGAAARCWKRLDQLPYRLPVPPRIDIRALLLIALDEKPPPGLPDRVMARVAALTTIVEFARMLGAAPLDWLTQRSDPNDDGNHE